MHQLSFGLGLAAAMALGVMNVPAMARASGATPGPSSEASTSEAASAASQAGGEALAQPTALPAQPLAAGIHAATEHAPFNVGVWPGRPFPGALLVVDVAGVSAGTRPEATFLGKSLQWHLLDGGIWRGLAPVADDAPIGKTPLALKVGTVGRLLPLEIQEIAFDEDELRVEGKYTTLPKAAQKQIARDRTRLANMWKKGSSATPRFTGNFQLPRQARTTAPYGTRRTFNGQTRSVHRGWDLDGKVGAAIVSPNDGVVTMAEDLYYSGGTLFIDHGGGLYTGYFHMSRFDVKPGDRVKKGQTVGAVGKSGRVTGPHLHWAARIGGSYVNPASLLFFDFEKPMVEPPASWLVEDESAPKVVPAAAVQ